MKDIEALAHEIQLMKDIEEIKDLKYKYIRFMVHSQWDELEVLLTEDCRSEYSDGKYSFPDRNTLMGFLRKSHDGHEKPFVSFWQVSQPEIELLSDTEATGIWCMRHATVDTNSNQEIRQFAWYHDRYRKEEDRWKICKTGYTRTLEDNWSRGDLPSIKLEVPQIL